MSMTICCINWDAVSAISNIIMAIIAFGSLMFSFCLLYRDRKNRVEDIRARLSFSIVEWQDFYMLKISNVGKETAYNIILNVVGSPITDNPIELVQDVFKKLKKGTINIEAGKSVYYLISPSESAKEEQGLEGRKKCHMTDIRGWLNSQVNEPIIITGKYNNRYDVYERFTIRDFNQYGAFVVNDPLQSIADAIMSHDFDDRSIQKNIQIIAQEIKTKHNGKIEYADHEHRG